MLLNWHTIDACFLSSAFHIRSSFTFFLSCLAAFLLVISLEFLRRSQGDFDRYLRARNAILQDEEYALPEETEEKLLPNGGSGSGSGREKLMSKLKARTPVVLEQLLRGFIHTVQFAVSYCIMLLFMYSNGKSFFPACPPAKPVSEGNILILTRLHYNFYSSGLARGLCFVHEGHTQLPAKSDVSTSSL
jgi:copper transporter 1